MPFCSFLADRSSRQHPHESTQEHLDDLHSRTTRQSTQESHAIRVDSLAIFSTLDEVKRSRNTGEETRTIAVECVNHICIRRLHVVLQKSRKEQETVRKQ